MRLPGFHCASSPLPLLALIAACSGGSGTTHTSTGGTTGIGPAGGTVRSSDGVVAIEIPAGALASDTNIEVEPITNTAPGGLGSAYRLLPAGTTFAVPARLTFALTAADLEGTTLDAIGVGFAGGDGRWRALDPVTRTETSVSAMTTHLSDWSRLVGWQIRPAAAHVYSGDHLALQVIDCEPTIDDDGVSTLISACTSDDLLTPLVSGWAVDGIPGGDLGVGMVQANGDAADYLAPIVVGDETFAVSVDFTPLRTHPQILLVSNVTVSPVEGDWTGTSHVVFPNTFETRSDFAFELDLAASTETVKILRVKTGWVTVQVLESDGTCTTSMGPQTFALVPDDGRITYFPDPTGGTFSATGELVPLATRTATFRTTCTDGRQWTQDGPVGGTWLDVSDGTPAFPGGTSTMSFSSSYGGFVNEWSFTR